MERKTLKSGWDGTTTDDAGRTDVKVEIFTYVDFDIYLGGQECKYFPFLEYPTIHFAQSTVGILWDRAKMGHMYGPFQTHTCSTLHPYGPNVIQNVL